MGKAKVYGKRMSSLKEIIYDWKSASNSWNIMRTYFFIINIFIFIYMYILYNMIK